jgi:hypothetical protein
MTKGFFLFLFLVFFSFADAAELKLEPIDEAKRDQYLAMAQVWKPTDVRKMSVYMGPQRGSVIQPNSIVTCRYIEWEGPPSGSQPKFNCKLTKTGEKVRIKYGKKSPEIYSEVAATRLFWALGFYADEVQPVKVRCLGCPEVNPFRPAAGERRVNRMIPYAILERRFQGEIIESKEDEGWSWKELDKVDFKKGGATLAQIDALKLLAVLVQHGDQKPQQQRIACYKKDLVDPDRDGIASCKQPVLMIQDLGATFGRADFETSPEAKINLDQWMDVPIWNPLKEAEQYERTKHRMCVSTLTPSIAAHDEGLHDPVIREEGRKFLAGLLSQLSEKQIHDIFRVARVESLDQTIPVKGGERAESAQDWVATFLEKRKQIVDRSCPE